MMKKLMMWSGLFCIFLMSCQEKEPLKIYNRSEVVDGEKKYDTIRDFTFINQDSTLITNKTFEDKIYVVNYFFTSCTTICPKVTSQVLRIYEHFEKDDRIRIMSTSIDTKYDTIPKLKRYADKLEVKAPKWNFVTGNEKEIYDIAYDYFVTAIKDPGVPDGYDHDDLLVLVDKNRHIRAFAHGTEEKSVTKFIQEIEFLLKTEYSETEDGKTNDGK